MHPLFTGIGAVDLLAADSRPCFVVDRRPQQPPTVAYMNPALSAHGALVDLIEAPAHRHPKLWEWIMAAAVDPRSPTSGAKPSPAPMSYANILWTRSNLREDLVVVSANEQPPSSGPAQTIPGDGDVYDGSISPTRRSPPEPASPFGAEPPSLQLPAADPGPELTLPNRNAETSTGLLGANQGGGPALLSEGIRHPSRRSTRDSDLVASRSSFLDELEGVDWASTPLGPRGSWPKSLQRALNQILVDSRPIAIYWGSACTTVYNEAFSKLWGSKHSSLLGRPVEETWPEVGDILRETIETGQGLSRDAGAEGESAFFVERESRKSGQPNWLEETYLKWSIAPINEGGECLGFLHAVVETTSMRLSERRLKMLVDLGDILVSARSRDDYWKKIIEGLEVADPSYDIPFAVLYSVEHQPVDESATPPLFDSTRKCRLAGALGPPEGHPITPPSIDLRTDDGALANIFRESMKIDIAPFRQPFLVKTGDMLPESLLDGLHWRRFKDPCRAAVVCPLRPTKDEDVMGLLLLGLNPRRPYDRDYRQYVSLLCQKLTTSLASTVLLEEEARRGRNARAQAEAEQAALKEKLDVQTNITAEWTRRFGAVANFIPVGASFWNPTGDSNFANEAWYKIMNYPKDKRIGVEGLVSCIHEEDQDHVNQAYRDLETAKNIEFEFRVRMTEDSKLKLSRSDTFGSSNSDMDAEIPDNSGFRHIYAIAKAECAPDGAIIRILTCLTDVTLHKRTAEDAVRKAQQAENLKRMAEMATVGMYDIDVEGRLISANNVFFEMCGLEKVDPAETDLRPFQTCLHPEDHIILQEQVERSVKEGTLQIVEFRLNTTWTTEDGSGNVIEGPRWVQATLLPVRSSEGTVTSFMGCLSDVSLQRWQLESEKQRKEEADQSRLKQESFIDVTSHEMRNPLTAVMTYTETILTYLKAIRDVVPVIDIPPDYDLGDVSQVPSGQQPQRRFLDGKRLLTEAIKMAGTIVSCAQYQKHIIDDILTVSKLDANLLAVTPVTVDPLVMVEESVNMFQIQASLMTLDLKIEVEDSYKALASKHLNFDPSRAKQVLINLLTNALKFTKNCTKREVTVRVGATRVRPTQSSSGVHFAPRSVDEDQDEKPISKSSIDINQDALKQADAPEENGDPVFLVFEVRDSGKGLSKDELKHIFKRFVQASNSTHVKYGGSGLGLFISRRLAELQNGAIGVASELGVGSTFAFYVECYIPTETEIQEAEAAEEAANEKQARWEAKDRLRVLASCLTDEEGAKGEVGGRAGVSAGGASASRVAGREVLRTEGAAHNIRGIFVVDDNRIVQKATEAQLSRAGFQVVVADHGMDCLEKLKLTDRWVGEQPNGLGDASTSAKGKGKTIDDDKNSKFPLSIILMDRNMPVMDGIECTRRIRQMEQQGLLRGPRIPIIATTADGREEPRESKMAGCDEVIVKPYRMPELEEKMYNLAVKMAALANADEGRVG